MSNRKYRIKTNCPQCGCSAVQNLSHEEMMARYGDVPNVELECGECMIKYEEEMKTACPEWDDECRMKE